MKKINGFKKMLSKVQAYTLLILTLFTALCSTVNAQFDGGIEDLPAIAVIGTANGGLITLATNATVDNTFQPGYEQSKRIQNIIRLSLFEETNKYLPADFTVTVPVMIEYGPDNTSLNTYNQNLTVTFNKAEGAKYNAKNYFNFEGAEYVRITINGNITVTGNPGINVADVLLLENEMRVTRYYDLQPGINPIFLSGSGSVGNPVDALPVSWLWPANTGHNATQLEWTWLEDELAPGYYIPNTTTVDLEKLFKDNTTRIDLPYNKNSFNIPLFYDGPGKLYYRIRPVNIKASGSRQDGQWTVPDPNTSSGICSYEGHNNALNWQVRTSFAEEGKMKSVMEYFDGSLRSRQTVTKENVNNTTIAAESFYDYEGRPVIQILPVPSMNTIIQYQATLNLFNGQTAGQNPAEFFDLSLNTANTPAGLYGTPELSNGSGAARYYSPLNDDLNTGPNKNIPDAEGYPYTVTRYMPDATGRVLAQSGIGPAHKMASSRETKYYYGTAAQEELDGLFGTEVGNRSHYFKNMVKDVNGQMSVSYTDMHGRPIATALAGDAPGNLLALNINDPVHYPNQAGSTIIRNLLDPTTNIEKGNAIESINTLLVAAVNSYTFTYNLAPDKLELARCSSSVQLCYDCLYDLEISITDESGDVPPVSWKFSNVSINPDDTCTTTTPALSQTSGSPVTINGNTISFPYTLTAGSHSIRKTLTISEASLAHYKLMYTDTSARKGICKTEQEIIDSVYNVLLSTSNCNQPPSPACEQCTEDLGTYPVFRINYLTSLGYDMNANPLPVIPPTVEAEILAAFNAALENCNNICNTASQIMASKRELMLADMMPYGGQYATEEPITTNNGITMYNKYNIFSIGNGGQPFYKNPWNANQQLNYYRNNLGEIDEIIHPGGSGYTLLNSTTKEQFTNQFVPSWAEALLPHHPEYPRLQYVEANLANNNINIYNWINTFNNTVLYDDAATAGYLYNSNASINDLFYTIAPAQYKTDMTTWITNNYAGSNLSLWQIARGQVMCPNAANPQSCFANSNIKVPPAVFDNLTPEQKNSVWQAFRSLYSSARESQVNDYIKAQVPLTDDATLIAQGYQLRFGSNSQNAQQYNWTWYPPVPGAAPPVLPPVNPGATYQSRCESYINQWKSSLLECEALANLSQSVRDQILTEITDGMKDVCVRGCDAANPYGSSTVAPGHVLPAPAYNSFEEVINQVFFNHSIATNNSYYCNPYVIEFPKPYGKNPTFAQEYTSVVDSCACAHFDSLKIRVIAANYDPYVLSSINAYLLANNMETLTQVLHAALLDCNQYQQLVCDSVYESRTVSCYDPEPCITTCAFKPTGKKTEKIAGRIGIDANPLTCGEFQAIIACFYDVYVDPLPNSEPNCMENFVNFFNTYGEQTDYTWNEIEEMYQSLCGQESLNVCTPCSTEVFCAIDTVCHFAFIPHYLPSPQPLPDYLKCGGWPPQSKCLSCDTMLARTTEFKTKFIAPYNDGPLFTGTNLTQQQIEQNILYARFLNFRTGFQYSWMEYAQAAATANCDPVGGGGGVVDLVVTSRSGNTPQQYIASNSITFDPEFDHPPGDEYETLLQPNGGGGGPQVVICRNNRPLNDTTGYFVVDTPCHRVHTMAISLGQNIYQQQQLAIQEGFERQYREKCMAAKNYEAFTVQYSNKEYHYTLYYYDMSGGLVKTVPPKGVRPDFSIGFTNSVKAARLVDGYIPRPHEYVTQNRFNSLGEVVAQKSPDASTDLKWSHFWHDRLGRLVVSQNAQQAIDNKYSYTIYDPLGRITEVGQKPQTTPMTQTISQDDVALNNWIVINGGTREQITYTVYDLPYGPGLGPLMEQQNLRNRVSYMATKNLVTDAMQYEASFYTYDIHGYVDTLLQDYKGISEMDGSSNRFKRMNYSYDLISGKVKMASYQPGNNDAFYYKYKYDAENRLTEAYTSRDKIEWERDAAYNYYKYGPLSRTVLGQLQVQGIDYANSIQGWLKGINGTNVGNGSFDIGADGLIGGANNKVARDIYGFALHYFDNGGTEMDYKAIGGTTLFARPNNGAFNSLYNGNIGAISVNNAGLLKGPASSTNALPLFYNYRYDQLNRIKSMNAFSGLNTANNSWQPVSINDYAETVSYDPNGNILSYKRNGSPSIAGKQEEMDRLGYNYYPNNNQLRQVIDTVTGANYTEDIDNQTNSSNYTYDAIGNLKTDAAEDITNINWTLYGKISSITKNSGDIIAYTYDASGNRITKKITPDIGAAKITVYVRDASGNVMSIYEKVGTGATEQTENHLYGSSRIGITNKLTVPVTTGTLSGGYGTAYISTFTRGEKNYELSNHLGNVLVTISDKKLQVQDPNNTTQVLYYTADVITATDYFPFGMDMPGRKYGAAGRYGFNGKEKDKDMNSLTAYDYGFRIYNPAIGKFLSVDPLTSSYPMLTPYQFASNRPIDGIDLDGLEYYTVHLKVWKNNLGEEQFELMKNKGKGGTGVDDHTDMTQEQFLRAHKKLFFSSAESKTYQAEGEGVLFIYYDISGKEFDRGMDFGQSSIKETIGRHGIWVGAGATSQNGPRCKEWNYYTNPYVGMRSFLDKYIKPIDEVDYIGFIHDNDQNVNYKVPNGFKNVGWLESDIAFYVNILLYQERAKKSDFIDDYTKKGQSTEAFRAAKRAAKIFSGNFAGFWERMMVGELKDGIIPPKLKARGMTIEQLNNKIKEVAEKIKKSGRRYATASDVKI